MELRLKMKIIEKRNWECIDSVVSSGKLILTQEDDSILITKHGAKQLIEILKEFVNENQ